MIRKIIQVIVITCGLLFLFTGLLLIYFNLPVKSSFQKPELGVTYSSRYARAIGLDEKEAYLALLDDLKARHIRLPLYWDFVEPHPDYFDFSEIDWQLTEAEKRKVDVILIIGQKVPRWPECHEPEWIRNQELGIKKQELLEYIEVVVKRYKNNPTVTYWQVENEPFLPFGICPPLDVKLLDEELALVRNLDSSRPVIVTDSGELSLWIQAAKRADVFGTTLYRSVVSGKLGIAFDYPIGPNFFKFKYWLIKTFAGQENIMIVELQGEPWLDGWTVDQPLEEQLESMNAEKLRSNVEFAEKTGFSPIYLWGAEWWYWLKEKKNYPQVWEEAKGLFSK
ncbi:MAG: cellulase family glycosylhydrolase [Candidatus Moranbacteria bacterium]|nr:cellulase family glycosylhydrolase [Candidatus Moranbacteria bacterium]